MKNLMLVFILLFFSLSTILATDIRSGQDVTISTPVDGDLYVGANTLGINAKINGDLLAGARICYLRDTILEDVAVAAQEIFLEAPVMEDVRLLAGQIHIRADVFGDLIVAGGTIEIAPEVTIHGMLIVGGGTVKLHGRVMEDIKMAGGEVLFDGIAEKALHLKAGNARLAGTFRGPVRLAAEQLELDERAAFYQDVQYWTEVGEVDFGDRLKGTARARYDEALRMEGSNYGWKKTLGIGSAFIMIARILSAALLIGLLVWAFQNFFRRTSEHLTDNFASSLGYGALYLFGMPLLILIALVTIIGIPVGIFSLATYGLSLGFAHIFAALLFTYWWQEQRQEHWKTSTVMLTAIGAFVVLKLISWIPILGWLVSLVVIATTFGAILRELFRPKASPEPIPEQEKGSDLSV